MLTDYLMHTGRFLISFLAMSTFCTC